MVATQEQKADALRRIIGSPGFHRAEVLKSLLEYLCRQEALGRAHEVTEYEVATKALGRSADFSSDTDSSVRTRFLALRKKLDEYYAGEGHSDDLRIEVPRGTYTLRFTAAPLEQRLVEPVDLGEPQPPPNSHSTTTRTFLLGIATGAVVLAVAASVWVWAGNRSRAAQEVSIRNAWGPMLERGSSVTLAIGTPASLFVRDFGTAEPPVGDPSYRLPVPQDQPFADWYQRSRNRVLGKSAILHPNHHSPLWGDAATAVVVSNLLGAYGVSVEVVPGARTHPVALRERNSVIVGRPEYTDAAALLVPEGGLTVEYSASKRMVGIHNRAPKAGEPEWWFSTGDLRHNYGLITVLSSDDAHPHKTVMFAGINSDGAEAGARFFTSPEKLAELGKRLQQPGSTGWPKRYQVVVRTESVDTYTLQTELVFTRIHP